MPRWLAPLLCLVAGFTDVFGFLQFGHFAGMMTGNTVLLGIALARGHWPEVALILGLIACFLLGIAGGTALRARLSVWLCLAIEAVLLLAAGIAVSIAPAAGVLLALAMGLQNAIAPSFGGVALNTAFLTGDLQKLVLALMGRAGEEADTRLRIVPLLWVGYLLGAVLGALSRSLR